MNCESQVENTAQPGTVLQKDCSCLKLVSDTTVGSLCVDDTAPVIVSGNDEERESKRSPRRYIDRKRRLFECVW